MQAFGLSAAPERSVALQHCRGIAQKLMQKDRNFANELLYLYIDSIATRREFEKTSKEKKSVST